MSEKTKKEEKKEKLVSIQFLKTMTHAGRVYRGPTIDKNQDKVPGEIAGFTEEVAKLIEEQKFGKRVKS